jgi:hypothetical protein
MKDPRTLLLTILGLGFVFYRLGFARGKRR